MKGNPEERAIALGQFVVETGATVRSAAQRTLPPAWSGKTGPYTGKFSACCAPTRQSATCAAEWPHGINITRRHKSKCPHTGFLCAGIFLF